MIAAINDHMKTLGFPHRFQGEIGFGQRNPGVVAHYRHATENNIGRFALDPAIEMRCEFVAIRTGVKEKIDDFNAVAGLHRLRLWQQPVVDVALYLLCNGRQSECQQGHAAKQAASDAKPGRAHNLFLTGAFLARPRDQVIEHLEEAFVIYATVCADGHRRPGHVFAVHRQRRRARNVITAGHVFRAFYAPVNRE